MKKILICISILAAAVTPAYAVETLLQNDSLVDFSSGSIQSGFVANELGAAWLESPCDGNLIAVQIFWRSLNGGTAASIEQSISISEAGTFPIPGNELETIVGPVLNDGVFNEYRFLDEFNVIPLNVPVTQGETYVVSFKFQNSPSPSSPSLVTDADGCQTGKNSLFAIPPNIWLDSCSLGLSGDFIIRAVVDCPFVADEVDLSVFLTSNPTSYTPGQDLSYQIIVSNAGPAAANATSLIDFFPGSLNNIDWICTPNNSATCSNAMGSGSITESLNLPANSSVIIDAVGTVDISTVGIISNTAQLIVPLGVTDTNPSNNSNTLDVAEINNDLIFADDFE